LFVDEKQVFRQAYSAMQAVMWLEKTLLHFKKIILILKEKMKNIINHSK